MNIPPEVEQCKIVVADIHKHAIDCAIPGGLYMEFGVADGYSLECLRKRLDLKIRLYGFDSFEGLPEEWNGFPKGTFKTHIRVRLPNTELVEGRFEDTVPQFVKDHPEHVSFMNIDCDLYSSTKTVLDGFRDRIVDGTVAVFDELFGYDGYEKYEYKALQESRLEYRVVARWDCYRAAVRFSGKIL
jgi:hypothetical protein